MTVTRQSNTSSSEGEKPSTAWKKWKLLFSLTALKNRVSGGKNGKAKSKALRHVREPCWCEVKARRREERMNVKKSKKEDVFDTLYSSAASSVLDHSAARHRIAVRPKKKQGRRNRGRHRTVTSVKSLVKSQSEEDEDHRLLQSMALSNDHVLNRSKSLHLVGNNPSANPSFQLSFSFILPNVTLPQLPPSVMIRRHSSASVASAPGAAGADSGVHRTRCESSIEGRENNEDVKFQSNLNSNVIFKRPASSTVAVPAQGSPTNAVRRHQRFLTSIEHWTLASEGLKKSIYDLGGLGNRFSGLAAECGWFRQQDVDNSLEDSIGNSSSAGSLFGEEVMRLLDDLGEVKDEGDNSRSSSGIASGGGNSEDEVNANVSPNSASSNGSYAHQCDAENTELEVINRVSQQKADDPKKDALENVNVRERRKVFILPGSPTTSPSCDRNVKSRSCDSIQAAASKSLVKALVMKFDQIETASSPQQSLTSL